MTYVDGFLLPIPEGKIEEYKIIAQKAGEVWKEHGALSYKECVLEDNNSHEMVSFKTSAGTKSGETAIFAFITYKSREDRDVINAKVMEDPRLQEFCPGQNGTEPPFDYKRMAYGGFKAIVDL